MAYTVTVATIRRAVQEDPGAIDAVLATYQIAEFDQTDAEDPHAAALQCGKHHRNLINETGLFGFLAEVAPGYWMTDSVVTMAVWVAED